MVNKYATTIPTKVREFLSLPHPMQITAARYIRQTTCRHWHLPRCKLPDCTAGTGKLMSAPKPIIRRRIKVTRENIGESHATESRRRVHRFADRLHQNAMTHVSTSSMNSMFSPIRFVDGRDWAGASITKPKTPSVLYSQAPMPLARARWRRRETLETAPCRTSRSDRHPCFPIRPHHTWWRLQGYGCIRQ